MNTEATRTIVQNFYDAYARGDSAFLQTAIADDIDWIIYGPIEVFPFMGARRGKAAVLETLAAIGQDYELKRYLRELVIVDGERAAVLSDASFLQRKTGRMLRFKLANFLRFRDGKLAEFREFSDSFDVTQQALGQLFEIA